MGDSPYDVRDPEAPIGPGEPACLLQDLFVNRLHSLIIHVYITMIALLFSSSERLVHPDGAGEHIGFAAGDGIFGGELRAFGVQQRQEV